VLSVIAFGSGGATAADFVSASGNRLVLGGQPWRAVGVNLWDMDAARVVTGDVAGCYYQHTDLDTYFDSSFRRIASETGATAVRTFAFMPYYTGGGANPDWSTTDKLLHYARAYNVRVVPVLGTQAGICGDPFKTPSWYHCTPSQPVDCTPGYRMPGAWGTSYRDYVVAVTSRYKDDATIAFWQLMNEAYVTDAPSDPTALADFAADMVNAIRAEAGDTNHLVSLGTVGGNAGTGSQLDPYRRLLDCTTSCIDVSSAHYYGGEALQGMPAQSTLTTEIVADVDAPRVVRTDIESRALLVDGWRTVQANVYDPQHDSRTSKTWGIRVRGAASAPWSVQIDHVVVVTEAGPRVYDFETGTDGFTAANASAVERTTDDADTGAGSLRVAIADPATGSLMVTAPAEALPVVSVSLKLRVNFTGPLTQPLSGLALASYMREATVTHQKPFVMTELGAWNEVSPMSPDGHTPNPQSSCAMRAADAARAGRVPYSTPHRALVLDGMLALQFNPDHASSGALVWDWKDPTALVTRSDGTQAIDPMINCFTITPGDPAEAILMKWATRTANPPIAGTAGALGAPAKRFTGLPLTAIVKARSAFALKGRVTFGGNPVAGAPIVASGSCTSAATSDALGHGSVVCRIDTPGTYTITLTGASPCSCTGARTYTITVVP
jgi:hypothetical protein